MPVTERARKSTTGPKPKTRRALSSALLVVGLLLVIDAACSVLWQEPVSALYALVQQKQLNGALEQSSSSALPVVQRRAAAKLDDDRRLAFFARALDARAEPGAPVGRLEIPAAEISTVVVNGTGTRALRRGPGHYPDTPLPGGDGTVAIAGHRTTYGAPFRNLDKLDPGDSIEVRMPYGTFFYEVERTRIVAPTALWVTRRKSYDRLVLTACHPLYSAAQRIVVFARQVRQVERPNSNT